MSYRIAFVFDDTLDVLDGVQQHIVTLGKELARRGHDVHYLVGQTEHSPVPNTHVMSRNVMVSANGNRMRIPLPASRRLIARTLAEGDFDILHVQAPYSPFMAGRVLKAASPNTGVVATYHIAVSDPLSAIGGLALGTINAHTHRRIDEVIAVSDVAARYAALTAHTNAHVIANPVDVAMMRDRAAAVNVGALDGDIIAPHIVFLGRFVKRKGADILLDAIEYGERHRLFPAGTHVTMAGKGPLLEECRRRAAGFDTPVTFTGFIEESAKPVLLRSADVAVFPATGGESFGIVLLEAIASGAKVTLAGDNPGYHSTLLGDTDALFPVRGRETARILAQRIARAIDDAAWAKQVHRREELLLERYDVRTIADQVEQVYAQAIAKRRAGRAV
ncbi:glycosyltransferase family 4 protein [Bifidobacterium thermophilum]|uniref:Phosphatidylinositol alpha-mannosyltransferase n=1 Tax=Bifidobacterium thermophilum RBL67 TaxID=1254439 RepID=M4RC08_9BIFI|nr:glycosyltransferase family 4 protein [Bifidobacterium thermophilum]AGH41006.1 Phosphatidylinositol alpha-mannosyltransferase [Bifidobacterium thermophilum RBL67]MDW8486218.1 glycosyltransferase family 4 protein [Bifidobacterium thermophilum]